MLHALVLMYWGELNVFVRIAANAKRVVVARLPSEAVVTSVVKVGYAFDSPLTADAGGLALDVKRDRLLRVASSGTATPEAAFSFVVGIIGSSLEGLVFEQVFQQPGQAVSAARLLQVASSQGIAVYTITNTNQASVLQALSLQPETLDEIRDAIAAGNMVIAPAAEITLNGWRGAGYIVIDPTTGAGAYRITGGLEGSFFTISATEWKWAIFCALGLALVLFLPFTTLMITLGVALAGFLGLLSFVADNYLAGRPLSTRPSDPAIWAAVSTLLVQSILAIMIAFLISPLAVPFAPFAVLAVASVILLLTMILIDRVMNEVAWRRERREYSRA
jgi:hypothetical protein